MRRGIGIAIAWTGATLLAVLVAAAAVGSVRSQVTDTPTAVGSPSAAALTAEVPSDPTTTTTDAPPTTTAPTTTTMAEAVTSTTAPPTTTTVPSTSTSTTQTTPTTTIAASYSRTFDTQAGSVRVIVEGDEVHFGGAFPNPGWRVELEDAGPERVKVHFERNEEHGEVQFTARLEDGELVTRIEVDDD